MGGDAAVKAGGTHGFVAALTSFVGRENQVAEVAALLGEYRLVTITGPGGMGKTRLAAEAARQVSGQFADGAWLVSLAAVQDPALVGPAVATAMEVQQAAGLSVTESLAGALSRRQLLLVLDNCEHVLAAVAQLCGILLPAADDMRVLATSREPIGVAGEARFRLRPLPAPEPGVPPAPGVPAAVRLFADRARQADPRFTLEGESAAMAARLVARLDGMPLAIELAAARVEALGLQQLLDRLENSLQLLTSADRTAAARHQSLAATVDWSYRLLSDPEQRVFRWLAIFPGPFTLDGAATLAGPRGEAVVLHLVDCSLISPPSPGPDGRARYLMLETIRAFGLGRLADAGERDQAAAALASYAVTVAERAAAGMRTKAQELASVRWLDAEDATLHKGLDWALDHAPETALRLAVALAEWWLLRGRGEAGRSVLLAAARHAAPGSDEWCLAQFWIGDIGPAPESLACETAAYDVLSQRPPSPLLAELLAGRSRTLMALGRIPEAVSDAGEALDVSRRIGYQAGEVLALAQLSRTAHYAGDAPGALEWARQVQRALGSGEVGWTMRFAGHFFTELLIESGDTAAARRSIADSLAWAREAGDQLGQASDLALMADLDLRTGNTPESGRHLRKAIEIAAGSGDHHRLATCLDLCAHLSAATGQWAGAVTLWAAVRARREADGTLDTPLTAQRRQEPLRKATQALGPASTQTAEERGARMTLETAAEFALMLADTPLQAPQAPQALEGAAGLTPLSARERELVTLVAKGRTDAQIASQLFISISTVRSHLDRIRDKTSCRRRADLTRLALQAGLA
jgi:predicted ATPase/DNA-binding CsgD family transcriptional regulator